MRKKIDWKDVGRRAGKTFVQTFVASMCVPVEEFVVIKDLDSAKAVLLPVIIAAAAAAISATWNFLIGYFKED